MLRSAGQRFAGRLLWNVRPSTAILLTRGLKLDTGIVGLPVVPNAREVLKEKINKVLADVAEQIPEDTEYRRVLEATYNYRMKAVESGATDEEVEEQFTMQLEQLIKQCDDELGLIPKMAEWKPWDVPAGHKIETVVEEYVDTVPQGQKA